jgi:carboxyl-terminal processing protease
MHRSRKNRSGFLKKFLPFSLLSNKKLYLHDMKKLLFFFTTILCLGAFAQKKFDSAAYASFNADRWEKVNFSELFKDTASATPVHLTPEQKLTGLSKCWSEAKYNFANFDLVPQLNWDSLYTAYIPKVMAATSLVDYYRVLQNFYQHLRDGHTSVNLPFSYMKRRNGILPLEIRWIENKAIVVQNLSAKKEEQAIKPGTEVVAWNGQPLPDYIQKAISPYLHFSTPQDSTERIYRYELTPGEAGSAVTLTFKTAEGKTFTQVFTYKPVHRYWDRLPLFNFQVLKGNIAYLQINSFNDEKIVAVFDSLFAAIAPTNALIIDVRNNGGGNGGNGFEILGCLTDKPFYTGKTLLRQYRPVGRSWGGIETGRIAEDDWKPYKNKLYNKPVVVLTSAATYSAAEDFTATFKSMKRGVVIGEPSGGSTGQPVFFALPGGGTAAVCSKRDFFSDGTEFVGVGIQPDVVVHPTAKSIAAGKDDVLEAAIKQLQK